MGLDEATQICPCPIPSWLADSGGKGITIITVCHGEAQLADRWGEHGKQTILDTSGVKIWLPGITATAHAGGRQQARRRHRLHRARPRAQPPGTRS